jgi:hypothetical protein
MPSVIIVAETETAEPSAFNHERRTFQLKERVTSADVSDPHVAAQLIERIGWALADAEDAERAASSSYDRRLVEHRAELADAAEFPAVRRVSGGSRRLELDSR